jgi:hypothetical protein
MRESSNARYMYYHIFYNSAPADIFQDRCRNFLYRADIEGNKKIDLTMNDI